MIRVAVSVEGETEEEFINEVVAVHLLERDIHLQPVLLVGDVTVEHLALDMADLYWSYDFVTSLVDFYGFRDKGDASIEELEDRIRKSVVDKIRRSFDESRIFPYVQLHEFEGLLFSDVNAFGYLEISEETLYELRNIRSQFLSPEDINDNTETAPSKRLSSLMPRYDKRVAGTLIALETGLDTIRAECPRFNEWLTRMETLQGLS